MTTATKIAPAPRWDLESIFPGGSASAEYKKHREQTASDIAKADKMLSALPADYNAGADQWVEFALLLQSIAEDLELTISFAGCLTSQNVDDSAADTITGEGYVQYAEWQKLSTKFEAMAVALSDADWKKFIERPELNEMGFFLSERREIAKSKMDVERESLALDLGVNGLHAWNQLYDKMAGELKVDFEHNGSSETLSLGQLATKFSDPNRDVRAKAFKLMTEAWNSRADLAAMTLNSLVGFRLSLYKNRKWDTIMKEPLTATRMEEATLDTMWDVIQKNTAKLKPYIDAKKKLLGIDKYRWYDEFAPCGAADKLYSFEEAGAFIIEKTRSFSDHMADFFQMALDKRWVEAENRPGKRGGAFCTGTGKLRQSRVFMTYSGTYENLLTLAHELGHAYHSYVLKDKANFATYYPMNLAETASIFAETLVTDAAYEATSDPGEKLMLLEQKLQNAYVLFCDIQSRYLFERSFYPERQKGIVSKDRLNELMIEAQKKSYGELLDESGYHPLFWCSKLHFYISDLPMYNFPYTFGFLFAGGVYDRAKKEGSGFADKYRALLADTGSMRTEELATKHLGVDLTKPDFWTDAVTRAVADVDEFVRLANEA